MGVLDPFRFVLISIAGWMNQQQQQAIEYLREENKVLREQLGGRRLRFTDEQRRRLAVKASGLGHRALAAVATRLPYRQKNQSAVLRRQTSSWRRCLSETSTTIEWKLQSNQRRNVFRYR